MSRFLQLQLADASGNAVPFQFIANDGNLVVNPIPLTTLDQQGIGERYDIVVDFSSFRVGDTVQLVNTLVQTDGRMPGGRVSLASALRGVVGRPDGRSVAAIQRRLAGLQRRRPERPACARPTPIRARCRRSSPSRSRSSPRSGPGSSPGRTAMAIPASATASAFPIARRRREFPWVVSVNGGEAHSLNANRISLLIPKPGEVEHWTYVNGGGEWDHPIHLHFEEGVTMNRGGAAIPATEKLVRKDVWRLRPERAGPVPGPVRRIRRRLRASTATTRCTRTSRCSCGSRC